MNKKHLTAAAAVALVAAGPAALPANADTEPVAAATITVEHQGQTQTIDTGDVETAGWGWTINPRNWMCRLRPVLC